MSEFSQFFLLDLLPKSEWPSGNKNRMPIPNTEYLEPCTKRRLTLQTNFIECFNDFFQKEKQSKQRNKHSLKTEVLYLETEVLNQVVTI